LSTFLIIACGKGDQDVRKKTAPPSGKRNVPEETTVTPEPEKKPPPDPRQPLLQAEWDAYKDTVITNDASTLPEKEREMLTYLLEAAKVVEELHMLQLHPDNLKWRDMLIATGTDIEKKIFFRNQMPWCEDNPDPLCRALEEAPPEKQIGYMHWPKGFTAADVKALSREINGPELLSPFTVVRKNPAGGYRAIPYTRDVLLGPKMKRLAELLRKAARYAPDDTLKTFLESRADAFEASTAFPYDKSDLDWIALKGDWEVTVGPYEVYDNPFQIKALFEMFIGREDKILSSELAKLKGRLQEMENMLAALVGETIYQPRTLDANIAIRAIDVWMASGDGRNSRGATVAFHLPNRGTAVERGLYKKVMLVNHSKAFEPMAKARADLVLEPAQAAMVNFRDGITNVTFHELSHGFGAYHEMKITDKEGRRTTIKEALRNFESLMEELKADVLGLMLSKYLSDKGELSEEALLKRYVCNLVHLLGLLQYPLDGAYPQMSAIQLGWFIDHGAVLWHPESGQLHVVREKMSDAVAALIKTVSTIQLQGDFKGAEALYDKYVDKSDKTVRLNGVLNEIREAIVKRFKEAGIKSPSLRYEVKGISH
jgi:hypothetical protein